MQYEQFKVDLNKLSTQLVTLQHEMDQAISDGKSFIEVKIIHLQMKELSRLIEDLKSRRKVSGNNMYEEQS